MTANVIGNNVFIIKDKNKRQYILNFIKERKRFVIQHEDLFGSDKRMRLNLFSYSLYYPFFIFNKNVDTQESFPHYEQGNETWGYGLFCF